MPPGKSSKKRSKKGEFLGKTFYDEKAEEEARKASAVKRAIEELKARGEVETTEEDELQHAQEAPTVEKRQKEKPAQLDPNDLVEILADRDRRIEELEAELETRLSESQAAQALLTSAQQVVDFIGELVAGCCGVKSGRRICEKYGCSHLMKIAGPIAQTLSVVGQNLKGRSEVSKIEEIRKGSENLNRDRPREEQVEAIRAESERLSQLFGLTSRRPGAAPSRPAMSRSLTSPVY